MGTAFASRDSTTTAVGAWIATLIDPFVGNILFAAFLVVVAVQMALKAIRVQRQLRGRNG